MNTETFPFVDAIEAELLPALINNRTMWVDLKDHILQQYWTKKERAIIYKLFNVFFERYKNFPTRAQALDIATRKNYGDKVLSEIELVYNKVTGDTLPEVQQYVYDEALNFIRNNKIKTALLESVDLLEKRDFLNIESKMKDAVNWNPDIKLGTDIQDVETRFAALENLSNNIIPSPWKVLNMLIGGGFYGKELALFAGTSSVGKSIALDNIAYHAWDQGYNVVMITLELSEVRKAQRIDSSAVRIPLNEVKARKDDVIKFFENKRKNNKLYIKEFPTSSVSAKNILNYLYQLELYNGLKMRGGGKHGLNLLIVDYLELMLPNQKKANEYESQGAVGAELRGIGQELDIPVVSACLDPNTEVITFKGKIKLSELKVGDFIRSKSQYNFVQKIQINKNTKKYKIKTKSGKEIICSANHLFPVVNKNEELSINTGLKIGQQLYIKEV
jgi:hypothetical protein